ncbi:MAG: hypothetical protein K8S27_16775 [Candidatus Omnitrophica bacterium]|nr:hypothetical protein [Candidatus Omnitrophota bacterium]
MKIIKSILASILAIFIFVIVWFLFDLALKLLDTLRDNRNFVQDAFRTLVSPGVGSYFTIIGVNKIFKNYSKNIVFYTFSSVLILFTVWRLSVMIPVTSQAGFGVYDFFIQILTPIVAILTAYITSKKV